MKIILLTYCNRSGSTFLANLLSSLDDICVCPESDVLVRKFLEGPEKQFYADKFKPDILRKIIRSDAKMAMWNLGDDLIQVMGDCGKNLEAFCRILGYYRDKNKPGADTILFKAERIAALLNRINLQSIEISGMELKYLSIVRDPRAVTASQLQTLVPGTMRKMTGNIAWSAFKWMEQIDSVLKYSETEENMCILRYEDLMVSLDETLLKLSEFLQSDLSGAAPERGTLYETLGEADRMIHNLSVKTPDKSRIDAWKTYLGPYQIKKLERICQRNMVEIGYESSPGQNPAVLIPDIAFHRLVYILRITCLHALFHFRRLISSQAIPG